MLFNSVIAAAVLATTTLALPSPPYPVAARAASTGALAPAATTAAAGGLSLTQQLFIADTAVDRFALLPDDKQFIFDFGMAPKGKGGKGGDLIAANRKTFPALVGTGSGMAVGFLGPCGFNTPHIHNRATELQIVTEGTLVTEMLPENGVFKDNKAANGRRVITNTVTKFQMTPFYKGSVHAQFNPDCTPTIFIAAFNNEDFGAGQVADELFAMTPDVVQAAFGQAINGADVEKFKAGIPATIALGVEQCLKKCGIPKR